MHLNNKEILITGGTGTLGKELTKTILREYQPKGIRIFSRDEFKQWAFANELEMMGFSNAPIAFLLGDVRDIPRVDVATKGVDIIIHTAALKQVPACEQHPGEAIKTNILGAVNIIDAAIRNKVSHIMNVSTDKAVYPVNLYGMTKGAAEKTLLQGNIYSGGRVKVSCCRYGNVINSRGSVIPLFQEQFRRTKKVTITHPHMTRFFIKIEDVVHFILDNIQTMEGGEIFVPKMKSAFIYEIAKEIAGEGNIQEVGIRQGEKMHECLITVEESKQMVEDETKFTLFPLNTELYDPSKEWSFMSNSNTKWWLLDEIKEIIKETYQ